jgi:RNA polymerase sigma-70 factor (ECF subfamily)
MACGTDPLLLGLVAGEEWAFAALYDRFAGRMYRAALRMLGRREDAEDAVQDVLLAAVRSRERLCDLRDLAAYLFASLHRAAGRCALQRARALPRVHDERGHGAPFATVDELTAPAQRGPSDEPDWSRLQQAIRSLSDQQREVLTLKIDGELTFAQIAQVLEVSVSTAASRYQYALRKLRASLAGQRAALEGRR